MHKGMISAMLLLLVGGSAGCNGTTLPSEAAPGVMAAQFTQPRICIPVSGSLTGAASPAFAPVISKLTGDIEGSGVHVPDPASVQETAGGSGVPHPRLTTTITVDRVNVPGLEELEGRVLEGVNRAVQVPVSLSPPVLTYRLRDRLTFTAGANGHLSFRGPLEVDLGDLANPDDDVVTVSFTYRGVVCP